MCLEFRIHERQIQPQLIGSQQRKYYVYKCAHTHIHTHLHTDMCLSMYKCVHTHILECDVLSKGNQSERSKAVCVMIVANLESMFSAEHSPLVQGAMHRLRLSQD